MRDLGHQLETEIAHSNIYIEKMRKLQGLAQAYNKTDRRVLSRAHILSGSALMELRDKRLALDAKRDADKTARAEKKAAAKSRKVPAKTSHRATKAPPNPSVVILTDDENETMGGNTSDDSWADVPILGNDGFNPGPIQHKNMVGESPQEPQSPLFSAGRLAPDRPLHRALRSRRPATKVLSGITPPYIPRKPFTNSFQQFPRRGESCFLYLRDR